MGLRIKVSPLFIIFSFLIVFFDYFSLYCTYITILLIHEFSHYIVARSKGYLSQSIGLMPYGLVMYDKNVYSKKDEISIYLAGPLVNILLAIIFIALWWYVPQSYYYTYDFVFANMVLGLYNLIPIYPLDGGRVTLAFCSNRGKILARKCMKICAIILSIFFVGLYIHSLFTKHNTSYLFMSFFLLSTLIDKNEYTFSLFNNKRQIREVKTYIVRKEVEFRQLIKLIKGDYYYNFIIVDENNKVIKKLTQDEVLEFYSKK